MTRSGVRAVATGAAPAVPGAVAGGTVNVLDLDDVAHLDPARIYVSSYHNVSNLITRTLTGYRHSEGKVTLVGDLATDTGRTSDGGKTCTFTLRDAITYEDGSKIVADDLEYGLERGFVKDYSEGPTYIQEWLANSTNFRDVYDGPYGGERLDAISAPDDKTLVFTFAEPHPDLPFAAAMPLCSPVKKSEDTKGKYDLERIADGQPNFDHFDDPAVNSEMDRISAVTDPVEAGREWAALDRRIMAQVPHVPYLYRRNYQLFGPRIGGAFIDPVVGLISLDGVYVKP